MSSPSAAGSDGNYRIEVANFGPIGHARVDLRPLTVFAGPSNTGKSYLAMLVYALHRCLDVVDRGESLQVHAALARRIGDWWSKRTERETEPLPDDLAAALRSVVEHAAEKSLEQEVRRCFGVDALADLVRQDSREAGAVITLYVRQKSGNTAPYRFEFGPEHIGDSVQVVPLTELSNSVSKIGEAFVRGASTGMVRSRLGPLTNPAYYLPADRTGVMHSHQVLVSTLIQSATTAGVRPSTNVPLLSGVLADFLDCLIGMSQASRSSQTRSSARAASRAMSEVVEKKLLAGGVIRLRHSETGYPSFAYRPANWDADLPLMRTSSMVSELAPVVLYLRHLVGSGDLLIIEEPESHLHPAMQAAFARELARLVRFGVRIMLTTHSEWMLEALANLVRLSELPEPQREGIPGADVALTPGQVGAWLFKPSTDAAGTVVEEIPLDVEVGNYPAGFDEVTESLYNEWVGISNRIEAARAAKADRRG